MARSCSLTLTTEMTARTKPRTKTTAHGHHHGSERSPRISTEKGRIVAQHGFAELQAGELFGAALVQNKRGVAPVNRGGHAGGIHDVPKQKPTGIAKYIGATKKTTFRARPSSGAETKAKTSALSLATQTLLRAALRNDETLLAPAATQLHRAAQAEADRRPRHAAVALAGWDALTCTAEPLGTPQRRRALWALAQALLGQIITTEQEMALLDQLDATGLDRVPPFEDSLVSELFRAAGADTLR